MNDRRALSLFTSQKHAIADMAEAGKLSGTVSRGADVRRSGAGIETTYRILRNAKERSYGHIQAETMGITSESLRTYLIEEIAQNIYPVEDTRMKSSSFIIPDFV